jgi:glycosyltransferase involved in cell wall biosynthesis
MKILIVTQVVDRDHTTLGFFTRWIEEFAKKSQKVNVVCLYKGEFVLPKNVSVFSLGKEDGVSRFKYIRNFFYYIFKLRKEYDIVFVHMNQEYVLLGGLFWKLFGKKIFFWRNHPYGNLLTDLSIKISDKVFSTADMSYAMRFDKTKLMPAGTDTKFFREDNRSREKNSLLVFGRISPIKKIENAIDLVSYLLAKGITVKLSIIGDYLERDKDYVQFLKKRIQDSKISDYVKIEKGVRFTDSPLVYQRHEVFLNFTKSGSFDKTVIEALACGCKVLVTNTSMKNILPEGSYTKSEVQEAFVALQKLLYLQGFDLDKYKQSGLKVVEDQSLNALINEIFLCINKKQ